MENPKDNQKSESGLQTIQTLEDFTAEYNIPPFDSYISYFDISSIGKSDPKAPESEKDMPCIIIKLREPLPMGKNIPEVYKGVRVFVS